MKNLITVSIVEIEAKVLSTDIETLSIIQQFNGMIASYRKLLMVDGSLKLLENAVRIAIKTGTIDAINIEDKNFSIGKPNRRCGRLSLAHFLEAAVNIMKFAGDANIFYEKKYLLLELIITALTHDSIEDSVRKENRIAVGFNYTEKDLKSDLSIDIADDISLKMIDKIVKNVVGLTITIEAQNDKAFTQDMLFQQLVDDGHLNAEAWYVRLCETITALGNLELLGFSNGGVMNIGDKKSFHIPKIKETKSALNELLPVPKGEQLTHKRIKKFFKKAIKNAEQNNIYFVPKN